MALHLERIVLGPVSTNTYLCADPETKEAVVVDPAGGGETIFNRAAEQGWHIRALWLTHAHFDHIAGVGELMEGLPAGQAGELKVGLHADDLPLWEQKGGAAWFGMDLKFLPQPDLYFQHGQRLNVGRYTFQVRLTPGHTQGHVVFYCQEAGIVFCGDVVFRDGIGRTDLPGGDFQQLMKSIRENILPLPDETRLLPGHGPETTVGEEKRSNYFLADPQQ